MIQKKLFLIAFIMFCFTITLCRDDRLVDLVTHSYQFLSVVDTYPTANGLDVPKNSPISIKFSQPMNQDTFTHAFSLSSNTASVPITNYTVDWSTDKTTVTLTQPLNFLTGDTIYNFKIGSGIRSATGNPIASDYFSTFVTGSLADTIPPTLTNITVKATSGDKVGSTNISGATIAPTISGVELKFDDTMVKSSVEKSFTLSAGGSTATPSGIVWSTSTTPNDTVLFQFNNLSQNANCEINLTSGALDKGGNGLSNPIKALSFFSGSFTGADPYETNDTPDQATLLTVGTIKYANIYPSGDVDWYKVNLTGGTNYNIRLQNLAYDYDVELYFPSTTLQGSSKNPGTTNELLNYTAPTTGTYYIKVFAKNGTDYSTSAYNILVEGVTGDAYEPGDNTSAGATSISIGSTANDHTLHVPSDVDYFKFNATSGTAYTVILSNVPPSASYNFEILNSSLAQVGLGNSPGLGSTQTVNFTASSTGTHYIRVYSASGCSTTPYSLNLSSAAGVDYTFISDTTPASPATGSSIGTVNFTIQNGGGTGGAQPVTWEIYLSSSTTISPGDTLVGSGTISALPSGGTATVSTSSGNWPSTAGTYYLNARLTASDDTISTNNTRYGTANVGGYGAPTINVAGDTYPNAIHISWSNISAPTYHIQRSPDQTNWTFVGSTTGLSYDDFSAPTSYPSGTTSYYRVRGYYGGTVYGAWSNGGSGVGGARTYAQLKINPSSVSVTINGSTGFNVSGGSGTYHYSVSGVAGGTIINGVYTNTGSIGSATITVTDDPPSSQSATANITVWNPAGPAGIQPSSLVLWLKADSLGLSNNAPVATWTDSSGNNHNATQTHSQTSQPTYQTNVLNGYPVVRFNGTNDSLDLTTSLFDLSNYTVFVVVKYNNTPNMYQYVWGTSVWFALLQEPPYSFYVEGWQSSSPNINYYQIASSNTTFNIHELRGNSSGTLEAWINGGVQGSGLLTNAGAIGPSVLGAPNPGNTNYPLYGDIAEVIAYSTALSDADRQSAETYLKGKYNLP